MLPSESAKKILAEAEAEAIRSNAHEICPSHLLWALLRVEGTIAHDALLDTGLDFSAIRGALERLYSRPGERTMIRRGPRWSLAARNIMEGAAEAAARSSTASIQPEFILLSLATARGSKVFEILSNAGIEYSKLRDAVVKAWGEDLSRD